MKTGQTGFTLIELVIVIGLISVLTVGIVTVVNPAEQISKANDSRRKSDLSQVQKALEQYYQDNGRYPDSSTDGKYEIVITAETVQNVPWGSEWNPYMNILPADPDTAKSYIYCSDPSGSGQLYGLYASLDRGSKDSQACNSGNVCANLASNCSSVTAAQACGETCNYGVTSPNISP